MSSVKNLVVELTEGRSVLCLPSVGVPGVAPVISRLLVLHVMALAMERLRQVRVCVVVADHTSEFINSLRVDRT